MTRKKRAPAYPKDVSIWTSGGHLKEIPRPHIRKFPGPQKRKVEVVLNTWAGAGGRHTYASLKEESNPLYDSSQHAWREAWDDKEAEGRRFEQRFDDRASACRWVQKTIEENFPAATHRAVEGMMQKRWTYREGD